ncbi:UDP-N-acetylmuramoyl-L-alanine--D-glutamate ligase [Planctomicrobium piriforme]|uniref:UDP-N-acetylmuramoylalanine--D-glutamate ligase n=1 Tax=Planctomicrobium piriforme TaxID=1576369 RepID=A0A1I3SWF9_9PLAN|nr:UDP-N-acetylmuramoyl-L-alanine--D-glutamate ligase [Planctomicrobium piriforme]SFJ63095.1 UDP-N-acetylmuramoylalanine--D-glutamate ligase [Planctomicrobium piriforme]
MGLGHFGGGLGAVKYLLDRGAMVTVTDLRSADELADSLSQLDVSQLEALVLGEHRDNLFTRAELLVVNPAVKPGNRYVELARTVGVPITSEINLFWQHCRGKKLVVTGSTGKSTTASLIHQFLQAAGVPSRLGGNIGVSLLPLVDEITPDEWVVLELSSFQLAALDELRPRPDIAVVTNFFPNHLDWHGTLDAYREAKQTAVCWQTKNEIAVLNADDADSALWPTDAKVVWYGKECWRDRPGVVVGDNHLIVRSSSGGWKIELTDLAPYLRTPHGLMNVAAAFGAVTVALGIPVDKLAGALLNFQGLPHRMQTVAEIEGRTFINDSKATTPEATIAALKSLLQPAILIAGGKDKGADLTELAQTIRSKTKAVALIGDTATALEQLLTTPTSDHARSASALRIERCNTLAAAVEWAWQQSAPGDAILLSPACASHGEFANYEQRGEQFIEFVKSVIQ